MRIKKNLLKENYKIFFIIYFILIIIISFSRFPDIKNELKYFIITDQILETKNFIILKYFNELYPDKPPIYFWLLSLIKVLNKDNFYSISLIIGGIIPIGITSYLLFKICKLYWSEKMAYISTAIFITLPYIFGVTLVLRMDTLMTMFIMCSLYIFFSYYLNQESISINNYLYLYVFIAIGILVKGGAALIIPLLTILCFLYLNKDLKYLKKMKILKGLFIILVIIGVWFILISISNNGTEYRNLLIGQETIGRVIKSKSHIRPIYYYLIQLPLTTLPIAPFFILGLYQNLKNLYNLKFIDKIAFSLVIPNLAFFSLISGKLDIYLLPLYFGIVIISLRGIEHKYYKIKYSIYKNILRLNCIIFSICFVVLPYYTKNYTLRDSVKFLSNRNQKIIYTYRFDDAKNISNEIGFKDIYDINLKDINNLEKESLILTRRKYKNNLDDKNIKCIYSNKKYFIFEK